MSSKSASSLLPLLRHNGSIICDVGRPDPQPLPAWGKAISLHHVALGFAYQHGDAANLREIAGAGEKLTRLVAQGVVDPQITRVIGLADVPQDLREVEAGRTQGKVVIRI